ncbi:MAG: bifunctional (p)ppGpp synthetase/guanosine-3',5'-bis(diphosphate) 3'-pyrophosphohydrolase [Pseudomonadaceae bacterium]|nr:bifunctional (p)ppGpp synthetase/guanosine-3',5'-bis(diphosphate) 3'-pyrophosphohydrolase [Pseudomonadaceae bacterium]
MIRQYELIDKIQGYNPKADVALINRAYVYSMKAHGNQRRASGQPYLIHPLEVADILADLHMDDATIAAGLLHDTLEDTLSTAEEIRKLFGDDVAELTEGVTKLSKVTFGDKSVEQAENFRKLLLAMSQDIRVLMIKLADRVHNMRTIEHKKAESQRRTAKETLDIFAPLADRIGLHVVKAELEDRAFKVLQPDDYAMVEERMQEWRAQDSLVDKVVALLKDELKQAKIDGEVSGREKAIYSIYRKMVRKSLAFDQLTDIIAYRVVVAGKRECYEVLGMLHDRFKAIPGRFKDYISAPKPNGYQSLHTAVVGPFGNRMEVQIRTREMHDIAENGVAAHWLYKPDPGIDSKKEEKKDPSLNPYRWLKGLVEQLQGVDDPTEFYENAKLELFNDNVFAFTPKGDLIQLPRGATPLDFAYAVHSNVGHKTVSAKVNGSVVPLRRVLNNGDMVEIITANNQQPNPGWRDMVVSSRARGAINRFLRQQEEVEQRRMGRDILEKAARRDGWGWSEKDIQKVLAAFPASQEIRDVDTVFLALGQGRLFPRQVHEALYPGEALQPAKEKKDKPAKGKKDAATPQDGDKTAGNMGLDGMVAGMAVHFAKCCSPLPQEDIVGIISTGRGVSVHMRTCRNLEQFADQPDRWLPVAWNAAALAGEMKIYECRIRVHARNVDGAISSITTAVAADEANILDIATEHRTSDSLTLRLEMQVRTKEHLNRLIQHLSANKHVLSVEKIYGWT